MSLSSVGKLAGMLVACRSISAGLNLFIPQILLFRPFICRCSTLNLPVVNAACPSFACVACTLTGQVSAHHKLRTFPPCFYHTCALGPVGGSNSDASLVTHIVKKIVCLCKKAVKICTAFDKSAERCARQMLNEHSFSCTDRNCFSLCSSTLTQAQESNVHLCFQTE
jgi:hypothetical protein